MSHVAMGPISWALIELNVEYDVDEQSLKSLQMFRRLN